ncbi:MAG: GMC family oxidoreductase [Elusimicrobia bacterium]|nr:GMC family oxidoreductase [Elusimicrobiota bacterium]
MTINGEKEGRPYSESYDYVIVGSGAAGAAAARVLADTGASIALVEEGPAVDARDFDDKLYPALRRLFRGMGAQVSRGRAFIPVIQGRCLGGGTTVNSAIVWRLPEDVWDTWAQAYGLADAIPLRELQGHWDTIERELSVRPTPPEVWGENNRLMDKARAKLGIQAAPTMRNESGCRGSGRCLTGCPSGAKKSALVTFIPYAEKKGAAVLTSAPVERVVVKDGRAIGVAGRFDRPGAKTGVAPFCVYARKAVLVAASAIQTPGLLRRSGVRSWHLGRHFQGHPGSPLVALFDQKVDMWTGATQGFDADHHRRDGRFKVETISLPPEGAVLRLPGVGRRWAEAIGQAPFAALWAVQMRAYAEGRVSERFFGTDIAYDLRQQDVDILRRALRFTAEMFFAAGAREVLPGIYGMPERIGPDELYLFDSAPSDPASYTFILSHLFGTARMSRDPGDGVVGHDFGVHGVKGLFVVDSSIFPTNIGVNPQHTIMAVAFLAAQRIAQRNT